MTTSASILADSVNPRGHRVTTFILRYPRFIHAEVLTHRAFSRNAGSTRAIPFPKMVAAVMEDPAMPLVWGTNQAGMVAGSELPTGSSLQPPHTHDPSRLDHHCFQCGDIPDMTQEDARALWLMARDSAVSRATALYRNGKGLHKQHVTRIIEPWAHITVIATATAYGNWYHLRRAPDAMPEIQALANAMYEAHANSVPVLRNRVRDYPFDCCDLTPAPEGSDLTTLGNTAGVEWNTFDSLSCELADMWHLPYVTDEERHCGDYSLRDLIYLSTGRCARVSYLTHDGVRDPSADIALARRIIASGHWSPTEHQCAPLREDSPAWSGNFYDWQQARKCYRNEHPRAFWADGWKGQ